jgi:hypothetical protein
MRFHERATDACFDSSVIYLIEGSLSASMGSVYSKKRGDIFEKTRRYIQKNEERWGGGGGYNQKETDNSSTTFNTLPFSESADNWTKELNLQNAPGESNRDNEKSELKVGEPLRIAVIRIRAIHYRS